MGELCSMGHSLVTKKCWHGSGTRCGKEEDELEDPEKTDVLWKGLGVALSHSLGKFGSQVQLCFRNEAICALSESEQKSPRNQPNNKKKLHLCE